MKKKILATLLAVGLMASMFTGCQGATKSFGEVINVIVANITK